MVPFITFRGPCLFPKPVTGQELIFAVSYSKPTLIISTFFSNPVSSSEKMAQLESMLKKRSGINLPSRHQILLNLKQELSNLYDSDPKLLQNGNIDNINKRLEFTKEKITILNILEGEETDSRFKGKFDVQRYVISNHA